MKVTVCELGNDPDQLSLDWDNLVRHVEENKSDFVLLPEMPFYPWPAHTRLVEPDVWAKSVASHRQWLSRLTELSPAAVAGSMPVIIDNKPYNQGFVWQNGTGFVPVHLKYYLPDEDGFWEASWYKRGPLDFTAVDIAGVRIGFLICTEMWFSEHARAYARAGVHLLLTPRATPQYSLDKWKAGGQTAAVMSGAFCLSSNLGGIDANGMQWGGGGWIIEPEDSNVLAITTQSRPYATLEIDPGLADYAKKTYPRYVRE